MRIGVWTHLRADADFPGCPLQHGRMWADYVKNADGGLLAGAPQNMTIEGLYAIGECDYHYHGANRLGANSLLSCIFTGLFTGASILNFAGSIFGPRRCASSVADAR